MSIFANDAGTAPGGAAREISGTATSNELDVTVDSVDLELKVNCDDLYHLYPNEFAAPGDVLARDGSNPDWGFGEKKDPDEGDGHFRVWDFFLFDKNDGVYCGNTDLAPNPGDLPVIFGPGQFQFQFIFANDTEDGPGELLQGSSDDNIATVTLEDGTELLLHVSCSDNFHIFADDDVTLLPKDERNPNWGWGEKDDPTEGEPGHIRVWDFFIFKLGSDNTCGNPDFTVGDPAIDIEKTPDLQVLVGGGVVFFTITVTNIGEVDLSDTAVTDPEVADCAKDAATVEGLNNGDVVPVGTVFLAW